MTGVVVFIATGWGPKHGGINAFNLDLCSALVKRTSHRVACVVPTSSLKENDDALKAGVTLITIGNSEPDLTDEHALLVLTALHRRGLIQIDWWIGHDVITGAVALAARRLTPESHCAIFHHMNYAAYKSFQGEASDADVKDSHQREVLGQADLIFAVGPKLLTSAQSKNMNGVPLVEVIPGLQIRKMTEAPQLFQAICFGRLTSREDIVKQGSLALLGFAEALRRAEQHLFEDPVFSLIGISKATPKEKKLITELKNRALALAGRRFPIHDLPYEPDRDKLFSKIRHQSVALMLSLHEGFGLVAWESIGELIPLIVSKNSGVHQLIARELGDPGIGCLKVVDVKGPIKGSEPNESDISAVADLVLEIARSPQPAKIDAISLRDQLLQKGYTWERAADILVEKLGLLPLLDAAKAGRCSLFIVDRGLEDDDSDLAIACCLIVYDSNQLQTRINSLKDDIANDLSESPEMVERIGKKGLDFNQDHAALRKKFVECIARLNCDAYLCVARKDATSPSREALSQHLLRDVLEPRLLKHSSGVESIYFEKQRGDKYRRRILEHICNTLTNNSPSFICPRLKEQHHACLEVAAYIAEITLRRFAREPGDHATAGEFDLLRARVRLLHDTDTGTRFTRKNPLP